MKTTKDLLKRYLYDEKDLIRRMKEMVPEEREDYAIAAEESRIIEEMIVLADKKTIPEFREWLERERERCSKKMDWKKYPEREIFPYLGRYVTVNKCLKWMKKDHISYVNDIYLP